MPKIKLLGGSNEAHQMTNMIETAHLVLRRPTPQDTTILIGLWSNNKVREFLGGILSQDLITEKVTDLQVHWEQYGFGLWAGYKKDSEEITGLCGLHRTDDGLEMSYMFFPKNWRQGFAREAARACLKYGFTVLKEDSIIAITQQVNHRSCRLLEILGMKLIHNFQRFDALQSLYKLNRDEYFHLPKHVDDDLLRN